MDVQEIITAVGARRFLQGCDAARKVGPHFGSSLRVTTDAVRDWDLANDISEMVWDAELPDESKMALILEFYTQLPDFWLLGYLVAHQWQGLTLPARQIFWSAARRILHLWIRSEGRHCSAAWSCPRTRRVSPSYGMY